MSDRRALIIGSWLAQGRDRPTPQKVISITKRWREIFKKDKYGFRSIKSKRRKPDIVPNPDLAELVTIFQNKRDVSDQTELLLYFVGHSTALGEDDLRLILSLDEKGEDINCSLRWLLDTIHESTQISKLIIILDTCHAGRTSHIFRNTQRDYFAMFATGSAYAFGARFSEGILRALEEPLRKNDQRIDRSEGGITYRKVFEYARRYVIEKVSTADQSQVPMWSGNYRSDLLFEAPVVVPNGFNQFASERTIYGRLYRLLELVKDGSELISFNTLKRSVNRERSFLLRSVDGSNDQYLSSDRLIEYLAFLRKAGWIIEPSGTYKITREGLRACNKNWWNHHLLNAVENRIFPDDFTIELLDEIVSGLLADMIPATPIKIKDRAGMKGIFISLDSPTRVALQILPSTGRFLKGSADAIFPSERGGA